MTGEGTQRPTAAAVGSARPDYSVIISCYYEENSIEEFHARLTRAMQSLGRTYEIVFTNDGSSDRTFDKLRQIFEKDDHVLAAIDFFKNSGQQAGITAGICESRGRAIILMDSDLQLAPEEIPLLVAEFERGYDVVSGYRKNRRDSLARTIPSKLANMIMRRASHSQFRDFGCTFKIYNADLVRAFEYGPHRLFSNVDLISRAGRHCEVPVSHHPRKYGASGWTFRKLMTYNMDNLVSISERPFQVIALVSLLLALTLVLRVIVGFFLPFEILREVTPGLLLTFAFISLLTTVALLCMVGEFSIRSFIAAKGLPKYVIRTLLRRPA